MEGDDEYLLGDQLAQFPPLLSSGSWAPDAGMWTDDDLLDFGNQLIHGDDHHDQTGGSENMFDLYRLFEDDSSGTEQLTADSSETNHVQVEADLSELGHLLQTEDASWEQSQVGDEPSPPALPAHGAIQPAFADEPAADVLTTEPDHEMDFAEMLRVAAECGEDQDARLVWSEEEHKQLLHCLGLYVLASEAVFCQQFLLVFAIPSRDVMFNLILRYFSLFFVRYAEYDAAIRCFKIAFHLPKKTALDVALRCRWLQDKKNAAQKNKDVRKVNKVKGTKGAKTSNKIYPLSKEALDSKSTKELIRDNNMFLKRLEENLKTGQLENTADHFYYLKTNMDAIEKRVRELGISIVMPLVDEQGLKEILRSRRLDPSAQIENS